MKKTISAFFAVVTAFTFAGDRHDHGHAGCGGKHHHVRDSHENPVHAHSERLAVEIGESAAENAGIETVHPQKRPTGSEYSFKGRFELVPEARETIASPVAGRMELKTESLARVDKGETLFTVTSPDIVSREKEIEILEKRLSVYREIKTPNAELENSLSLKKAELNALLMGHTPKNGTIEIKAPKSGLVEEILELNGTWLETGKSVLKLTDTSNIRFKGLVPADDAAGLKESMTADVGGANGSVRLGIGSDDGLVPVYVVFGKAPNAVVGARDTATVITGGGGDTETAVPDAAVVEIDLVKHVFVRDCRNKNRFIAVRVTTGGKSGGWTSVTGLPDGHIDVVSKGAYQLKLAVSSSGKSAAGHFHADGTFHEGDH